MFSLFPLCLCVSISCVCLQRQVSLCLRTGACCICLRCQVCRPCPRCPLCPCRQAWTWCRPWTWWAALHPSTWAWSPPAWCSTATERRRWETQLCVWDLTFHCDAWLYCQVPLLLLSNYYQTVLLIFAVHSEDDRLKICTIASFSLSINANTHMFSFKIGSIFLSSELKSNAKQVRWWTTIRSLLKWRCYLGHRLLFTAVCVFRVIRVWWMSTWRSRNS